MLIFVHRNTICLRMRIVRTLLPGELGRYADHLRRLEPEARRSRFGSALGDDAIDRHVAAIDPTRRRVIAVFADSLTVVAAVELCSHGDNGIELAFSVEKNHRHLGLGRVLMERAVLGARNRRRSRLVLAVQADNLPMRRLAQGAGFALEVFDGLAEGAFNLPDPTPASFLHEARLERDGAMEWMAAAAWTMLMARPTKNNDDATRNTASDAALRPVFGASVA